MKKRYIGGHWGTLTMREKEDFLTEHVLGPQTEEAGITHSGWGLCQDGRGRGRDKLG